MVVTVHDLVKCNGINDTPPSINHCLLRAALANLKAAVNHGHIGNNKNDHKEVISKIILHVLNGIESELHGGAIDKFHVDSIYPILCDAISRLDNYSMRRKPDLNGLTRIAAVTIHKYESLRECLTGTILSKYFTVGTPSAAQVQRLCDRINKLLSAGVGSADIIAAVYLGRAVLWVTPLINKSESKKLLLKAQTNGTPDAVARSQIAGRLRELLGLAEWPDHVHAIALTTHPIAVVLRKRYKVTAPTIFDAPCHIRFRHWKGSSPPDTGRTYDLNRDRRREKNCGADELVTSPLLFTDFARADYVGNVGSVKRAADENQEYANDIAGDDSLEGLIKWLAIMAS